MQDKKKTFEYFPINNVTLLIIKMKACHALRSLLLLFFWYAFTLEENRIFRYGRQYQSPGEYVGKNSKKLPSETIWKAFKMNATEYSVILLKI